MLIMHSRDNHALERDGAHPIHKARKAMIGSVTKNLIGRVKLRAAAAIKLLISS